MSLYGHKFLEESYDNELEGIDLKPFIELMAYDDISRASEEQIHEFCDSELAAVLQERQVLNKTTMMRLDKASDVKRRTKLVAYQLAKNANDPAFRKMCMFRTKMKEQRAIVMKKYGKKAAKIANVAQREYIKTARKEPTNQYAYTGKNTELKEKEAAKKAKEKDNN